MEKPDTDKRSEFLEHVLKLNEDIELSVSLKKSSRYHFAKHADLSL